MCLIGKAKAVVQGEGGGRGSFSRACVSSRGAVVLNSARWGMGGRRDGRQALGKPGLRKHQGMCAGEDGVTHG